MKLALAVCVALLAVASLHAQDEMGPPVRQNETRITNGNPAWPGQFPYMAYIRSKDASEKLSTECAGTLIKDTAVLTAAWCVDGLTKHTVRLGSINREGDDKNAWTVESGWAMKHPQYNKSSADYDVAIIFLPEQAPLHDEDIQLVNLPSSFASSSYVGCPAVVTGWGRYTLGNAMPEGLRWADVVVIPNVFCKKVLPTNKISERQLCAAGSTPNAYGSDGGAPLLLKSEGGYVQIGVYSRIPPDSFNTTKPASYTRVSAIIDWIDSTISVGNDEHIPGGSEEPPHPVQ